MNSRLAVHSLQDFKIECLSCKAFHWADECLSGSSKTHPKFGMCCYQGKLDLPILQEPPAKLKDLYNGEDPVSKSFRKNIRRYNNVLAFTSVGREIDYAINDGQGPWVFRMHGELIHKIGSLLPWQNATARPVYAQLYLYDPQTALDLCMGYRWNTGLCRDVMVILHDVLYRHYPGAELYRHAKELIADIPKGHNYELSIHFDAACNNRHYNEADAASTEISVMIPDESFQAKKSQDIIIHLKDSPIQQISDCHPFYPALRYVVLFPKGQLG